MMQTLLYQPIPQNTQRLAKAKISHKSYEDEVKQKLLGGGCERAEWQASPGVANVKRLQQKRLNL